MFSLNCTFSSEFEEISNFLLYTSNSFICEVFFLNAAPVSARFPFV